MTKEEQLAPAKVQPAPETLRGPEFNQLFDAFLGFDLRLLITIRDLILHPVRVARDAVNGNKDSYLGQVRLFFFLLGIQTIFMVLMQAYDNINVEAIIRGPEALADYADLLAAKGFTLAQANAALKGWFNLLITPVNLVFIIVFTLFFKMIAPKITLLGHALIYITANNAATLVGVPLAILAVKISGNSALSNLLMTPVQLFYLVLFIWVFMRKSVWGGIGKLILMLLAFVLAMALAGIIIWGVLDILATAKFGAGPMRFMFEQAFAAAREAQAAAP